MEETPNVYQAIDQIIAELTVTIARIPPDPMPSGTIAGANVPGQAAQTGAMTKTRPIHQGDRREVLGPIGRYYQGTIKPRIRALYRAFRPPKD